jgi:hypothetical protein
MAGRGAEPTDGPRSDARPVRGLVARGRGDFEGALGGRGALGRRAASVGGRPGSQGRRVALARRVRRASVATSRRGLVLGLQFQTRLLRACFSPNN